MRLGTKWALLSLVWSVPYVLGYVLGARVSEPNPWWVMAVTALAGAMLAFAIGLWLDEGQDGGES